MSDGEGRAACGSCRHWFVLDDWPRDVGDWHGCCTREMADGLGAECAPLAALEWAYAHERDGRDGACDWYEEER